MLNENTLSQRAHWAAGQPISDLMSQALANPGLISLAAGFVDQASLPVEETRLAVQELLADTVSGQAALQYGTTPGYRGLRELLVERLRNADSRLDVVGSDRVVVTAGSNQFLHLLAETLLNPGDVVLCAAPTYLVFLGTLGNLGACSVGVATDDQGMIPESLDDTLRAWDRRGELNRIRAVYLVTDFDNPQGITLSLDRRAAIVEIAKRWSRPQHPIHVIADDAYNELRYEGENVANMLALDDSQSTVISAGTFSKSFSPGLRVGWGILPEYLVGPVCAQKGNYDFGSPNFAQHLMTRVMASGLYDRHIELIRQRYRVKRDAMLDALDEFMAPLPGVSWIRPEGGLYVWLTLPSEIDAGPDGRLFAAALTEGMLYVPGQYCFPAQETVICRNTIRLSFGVQEPPQIRQGIRALASAIRHVST